jgi:hypothetical protein
MGLGNVCGEFDVLGVERFLADLRTYGKFAPRLVLRREDAYGETRRGESASGSRGSRSFSTKLRIPAAEHLLEFVVQDFGPRL